jgi:hypothetical protein
VLHDERADCGHQIDGHRDDRLAGRLEGRLILGESLVLRLRLVARQNFLDPLFVRPRRKPGDLKGSSPAVATDAVTSARGKDGADRPSVAEILVELGLLTEVGVRGDK